MLILLLSGLLLVTGLFFVNVQAEKIDKCALANLWFTRYKMDEQKVGTMICIAMAESDLDIDVINYKTGDYGLYQINNRYWCDDGEIRSANLCNIECQSLLGNAKASIDCAYDILLSNGYGAWYGYFSECKGRDMYYFLDGCIAYNDDEYEKVDDIGI